MRAAVLVDVGRIEVRHVRLPPLRPDEVRVRVQAVGLCGTDLHIFEGHANYNRDVRGRLVPLSESPQVLGHEIAGVIEETGGAVRDLAVGDRVVLDQGRNCRSEARDPVCEYCATGDSHQCEHYAEHGITGLQGGFAETIAVPAVNAVRLESDLEPVRATLTEPLGCIVHSTHLVESVASRYTLRTADRGRRVRSVLITGGGPSGLMFVQYLRNVIGFEGTLLVSEPNALKRSLAERFGAEAIDPDTADLAEVVRERTGGRLTELLIEASGVGAVFARIPELIRKQATVLLYGHGHAGQDLSALNGVLFLEPALVASVGASGGFEPDGRPATYVGALGHLEAGRIEATPLITHRYETLDAVPAAFGGDHARPDYVKGVITL
jgi:L-iditol 2-dehydrogenase